MPQRGTIPPPRNTIRYPIVTLPLLGFIHRAGFIAQSLALTQRSADQSFGKENLKPGAELARNDVNDYLMCFTTIDAAPAMLGLHNKHLAHGVNAPDDVLGLSIVAEGIMALWDNFLTEQDRQCFPVRATALAVGLVSARFACC